MLPYFALTFFQPTILPSIGLSGNALLGALLGTVIALVGATVGWFLVDKVGRRKILVLPMFCCPAFLLLAAAYNLLPAGVAVVAFPSSVRGSGVGVATAASLAAALGTFPLPTIQSALGTPAVLIIMGAVSLIGGVTSFLWAPETNGRPLTVTSHPVDPHRYRRKTADVTA